MTRRELWIPVAVLGLTVAFALACALVRLSRGNAWLVRRKLRLGALLLGLTWSAAGCNDNFRTTCYMPARFDQISFDERFYRDGALVLDLAAGDTLTGTVSVRASRAFFYRLLDAADTEVRRGDLVPTDGAFDEATEAFRIVLAPPGLPARGTLLLYSGAAADTTAPGWPLDEAPLTVIPAP